MTAPEPDRIVWHTSSYSGGNGNCVEVGWHTSSYSAGSGNCVEVGWHTSSYSAGSGNCVEVGWHTSSYSGGNGDCVEVAPTPDAVLIRDTKDRDGPALTIPRTTWHTFLRTVTH